MTHRSFLKILTVVALSPAAVLGRLRRQVFKPGTVAAAVSAAKPGETVFIGPGLYTEGLLVQSDIAIHLHDKARVRMSTPLYDDRLHPAASNFHIRGGHFEFTKNVEFAVFQRLPSRNVSISVVSMTLKNKQTLFG